MSPIKKTLVLVMGLLIGFLLILASSIARADGPDVWIEDVTIFVDGTVLSSKERIELYEGASVTIRLDVRTASGAVGAILISSELERWNGPQRLDVADIHQSQGSVEIEGLVPLALVARGHATVEKEREFVLINVILQGPDNRSLLILPAWATTPALQQKSQAIEAVERELSRYPEGTRKEIASSILKKAGAAPPDLALGLVEDAKEVLHLPTTVSSIPGWCFLLLALFALAALAGVIYGLYVTRRRLGSGETGVISARR